MNPKHINTKLKVREEANAFRQLRNVSGLIDFSSNDYLGLARSEQVAKAIKASMPNINGATGSRLLTGHSSLYEKLENNLCVIHNSEAALIFNSGYNANLGLFSCVPKRGDVVLYDEFSHASIRDGIQLSKANSYKFKHNDLSDLEQQFKRIQNKKLAKDVDVYVVTESVFSMDGDTPDLKKIVKLCQNYKAYLIVDEAHALGVYGLGLVQEQNLGDQVFARVVTFGKALGCHGAVILGSHELKKYLVNFSRPFIYTTAMPPHSLISIQVAYDAILSNSNFNYQYLPYIQLKENINTFVEGLKRIKGANVVVSKSAIQSCIIQGNDKVKTISKALIDKGYNVMPILSPTVPEGKERIRFCIHSYNTKDDIKTMLNILHKLLK